jgi:hypothetical protein
LQVVHFGAARMGFGDLFVAGLVGCLLASAASPEQRGLDPQLLGATLVAVFAVGFDLLFFAVDTLPATVPVAVALALVQRAENRSAARATRSPRRPSAQL